MAIKDSAEAVLCIAKYANPVNGVGFDDATVTELATFFLGTSFLIAAEPSIIGGVITTYQVGIDRGRDDHRIGFRTQASMLQDPKKIGFVFVVPMIPFEADPLLGFPRATIPPKKETWKLLDLTSPAAGAQVVLTSQLTGCTFAIGTIGNHVYMGHAQPKGITGNELAEKLSKGPIFDGLPDKLQSKFLIQPGDKSKAGSALGYGGLANVLGLVVGHKVSFIVAIMSSLTEIKKVMLVAQVGSSSKWESKEVSAGKTHRGAKEVVSNFFSKSKP